MKKRTLLLLGALLVVAPAVAGQSTWQTYTVKGEEFSVALPTVPAMTSSITLNQRLQKYRVERHLSTLVDGVAYTVDVFENPNPGESLNDFIAEQNTDSHLDLTTARDVTINGIHGKEYSSGDKTGTVQLFATERRLFRFAAGGSLANNAAVQEFFSSIALSKPEKATEVVDGPGMPLVLDTGERIYKGKELDTKARLISKPDPEYTDKARRNRIRGTVILRAVFSKTGEVTNIQVVASLPDGLTERCVEAAKRIKFVPATKNGQPASMWIQLEYNFNL